MEWHLKIFVMNNLFSGKNLTHTTNRKFYSKFPKQSPDIFFVKKAFLEISQN